MNIPILLYHNISKRAEKFSVTVSDFYRQMEFLAKQRYKSVTFENIFKKDGKKVLITFDDGYKNVYKNAFPILKEFNFTATVFIISNLMNKSFENREMLNIDELKALQKLNWEVGSHTLSHLHLTKLSVNECDKEIYDSKKAIEKLTKKDVVSFSYPYNEFNDTIKSIVKKSGYKYACAISSRNRYVMQDLYEIRRIYIKDTDTFTDFKRKIANWYLIYRGVVKH